MPATPVEKLLRHFGLTSLPFARAVPHPGLFEHKSFAEALERSALAAHGFAEKVSALQERWLEQARRPRPQSVARRLVALLPAHPVVDLSTVRTVTGATSEAVRQAILRLERAGVLVEVRGVRRNRVWESVGLFALLDGLERDLGPEGRTPRRPPTSAGSVPAP